MPPAKHTHHWPRYVELCAHVGHVQAVQMLAHETGMDYSRLRVIVNNLRQAAEARGEAVPVITAEELSGMRRDRTLAHYRRQKAQAEGKPPTPAPAPPPPPLPQVHPSARRPPGAWNPAPLRALMEQRGVTCNRLSALISPSGTASGHVKKLLRGEGTYPKIATLQRIADALDVPLVAIQGDYQPPDRYTLMFSGHAPARGPRAPRPPAPDAEPAPPPGLVRVESLDDFIRRLPRAAERAQRRRALRAAGMLPYSALQRSVKAPHLACGEEVEHVAE